MKLLSTLMIMLLSLSAGLANALESIRLTDVIKSNGSGNINVFKDVTAAQLEELRMNNNGMIVLGVDVNEASDGTEKATTQAVTLKTVLMKVTYGDGTQKTYDSKNNCCHTETQTLVAESPGTQRLPYFTFLGESGSSRITANNSIQGEFDSTLKINVPDSFYDSTKGFPASVTIDIVLLNTNVSLGDPEAFYDYSNGFEDLALLNAEDTAFIDNYGAGRDEAPAVILTNPPATADSMSVSTWNYFPSANSYYMVGYEDLYPAKGDYDFNDLTVAYQVRYGLNEDNKVVTIRGTAYLITRGAGYNHNWHLQIGLPEQNADGTPVSATLDCTTFLDSKNEYNHVPCDTTATGQINGDADMVIFSGTKQIFADPYGNYFTNAVKGQLFAIGPKSMFRLDLNTPVAPGEIAAAPFDPHLEVLNTGKIVKLLEVDPQYKDENGFPFGMLLPSEWRPPLEYNSISDVYPLFDDFVASEGSSSKNWYNTFLSSEVVQVPSPSAWAW